MEVQPILLFLSPTQKISNNGTPEHLLLEPEVLHVLAPPFVSRSQAEGKAARSHGKRRRSFLRKKRELPPSQGLSPACPLRYFYPWRQQACWFPQRSWFDLVVLPVLSLMIYVTLFYGILAPHMFAGGGADGKGGSEDVIVPKDIDLMALPQLCFPGIGYTGTQTDTDKS